MQSEFVMKLLVVDADDRINERESSAWRKKQVQVVRTKTMHEALEILSRPYEAFIAIAINADNVNYIPLLPTIKDLVPEMPIVAITAHKAKSKEFIVACNNGADYLGEFQPTSPENVDNLLAFISKKSIKERNIHGTVKIFHFKELTVVLSYPFVFMGDVRVHVTPPEYAMLEIFTENHGKPVPYNDLLVPIWGEGYRDDVEVLRQGIRRLRGKLGDKNETYIKNILNVGYMLNSV